MRLQYTVDVPVLNTSWALENEADEPPDEDEDEEAPSSRDAGTQTEPPSNGNTPAATGTPSNVAGADTE